MKRLRFCADLTVRLYLMMVAVNALANPALPSINTNNILNITNAPYNAVGDGVFTNTTAIQNALNLATKGPATNGLSGGTVEIPPGIFLSGPLILSNNVNLQLDAGAVLRMLPFSQYPGGIVSPPNFIAATNMHDIEISGTGAIDGQGAPWWPYANTNGAKRPNMINPNGCNRVLIQYVTLSNSPQFHITLSGKAGNTTVLGVTERAPSSEDPLTPGHNTDACDVTGTNILVQDCNVSVGDDNFACGGGTSGVMITNCTYGAGHGVSIGSFTDSGGVSNFTVINCTFNNTDGGIRIKSDRGRGGVVQNINYYNLSMTNVMHPILIYCEYTNLQTQYRALDSLTPAIASTFPSATNVPNTPSYRDITLSNITATTQSGRTPGLIWGLPESFVTNVTLINCQLTAGQPFEVYDARNVTFINSKINVPGGVKAITYFNADLTLTNNAPVTSPVVLDGLSNTNGPVTALSLNNAAATMTSSNAFGVNTLTLNGGRLTNTGSFTLSAPTAVNFALGTNPSTLAVIGNLTLATPLNITNAPGFTATNYLLFTYTGTLGGSPVLGTTPNLHAYGYSLNTSTAGQVKLVVTPPAPPVFGTVTPVNAGGNLAFSGSGGVSNATYYVLATTNAALPLNQWTVLATNQFSSSGGFSFTNTALPPQQFFRLQIP